MNFKHYAGLALVAGVCLLVAWGIHDAEPTFGHMAIGIFAAAADFLITLFLVLKIALWVIPALLIAYGIVSLVERRTYGWKFLRANKYGNYAQPFDLKTGELVRAEPGNYRELPEHYHNAPHISRIVEEAQGQPSEQSALPERTAPRLDDFYEAIRPNSLQTGLGARLANGELVTASIPESVHYKLIGGSGFGKSCLAAGMLDIATTTNSPDVLRIALLDLEWKTARLFEHLPHVYEVKQSGRVIRLIGRDADEVAARLGTLKAELNRRAAGTIKTPLLLIYVEEMLSLRYEVDPELQKQMLADLNILAIRGRKYGMFFLACMQVDYSSKELREAKGQFRTRAGFAIDTKAAQASGFMNTELVKQNFMRGKPGHYLLEKPAFSELVVAPRYDVEQKLGTSNLTSNVASTEPFFDDLDATVDATATPLVKPVDATRHGRSIRELKVLEMLRAQAGVNEIIEEIWHVKSNQGRPYRAAAEEYRQIVARLVAVAESEAS